MASVRGKQSLGFHWDVPILLSKAISIIIYCQHHIQQQQNIKFRDLLKSKRAKTQKLNELSKTEKIGWYRSLFLPCIVFVLLFFLIDFSYRFFL